MDQVRDTFRSSTWGWLRGTLAGWATVLLGLAGLALLIGSAGDYGAWPLLLTALAVLIVADGEPTGRPFPAATSSLAPVCTPNWRQSSARATGSSGEISTAGGMSWTFRESAISALSLFPIVAMIHMVDDERNHGIEGSRRWLLSAESSVKTKAALV
jgi:hypothetical protein